MTIDEIELLIQRLQGSSIRSLTVEDEHYSLSLEFGTVDTTVNVADHVLATPANTLEQGTVIESPEMGVFYHQHPFTESTTDLCGQQLTPDIIIGYVIVETTVIPIYPTTSGTLKGYSIDNAQVVGYGDVVATLI
ncbi:hypothetical protein [Pseudomonas sp. CCC3.1]|uniref:hypothetical protein n=1 Tax=Pseudomonas sp. CCC3.1 TaxID=3048607 RepID=UPI002AC9CCE4|nr:hypothetical protein [Pseudomonas sp. CCC3.1]MEB0205995.1 hypothetical protein [Pseudomonas sp. CCC3.1]WPX37910.1 hypothetical protein RHM56_06935 [Pseudomonas sp. CCC3.1]